MAENKPAEPRWPVSEKTDLLRLKAEFKKPVPRILLQCPLPSPHPDRDPDEAKAQIVHAAESEKVYAKRIICRVTRLAAIVVNPRFQGIEISPCGYPIRVPQSVWIALPLAAVEVLERAYINIDQERRLRKNIEADTSTLGYIYKTYKVWEFSVERWNLDTGESWQVERASKPIPVEEEDEAAAS